MSKNINFYIMKNQFILAYKDIDGKDFNGFPWLENFGNDINDLKSFLKNCNYITNPIVFLCNEKDLPEIITWDFVNEHKIELAEILK